MPAFTGEYEVIVVPAASELKTLADLVAKLKADPGSVSWAGGSAGGTDHITAGLFARALSADPKAVNYIAFSGGGEALAAVLGAQTTLGISGYGEFQAQVEAGALRVLDDLGAGARIGHRRPDLQGRRRRSRCPELARHLGRSGPQR